MALGIQLAMRMRHVFLLWPVPLYKMLLHYLLKSTVLEKIVIEGTRCVLIFSTTYLNHFLILKELREV
jgi:hypothetical protein